MFKFEGVTHISKQHLEVMDSGEVWTYRTIADAKLELLDEAGLCHLHYNNSVEEANSEYSSKGEEDRLYKINWYYLMDFKNSFDTLDWDTYNLTVSIDPKGRTFKEIVNSFNYASILTKDEYEHDDPEECGYQLVALGSLEDKYFEKCYLNMHDKHLCIFFGDEKYPEYSCLLYGDLPKIVVNKLFNLLDGGKVKC